MVARKEQQYELVLSSKIQQLSKVEKFLDELKGVLHLNDEQYYRVLVATTEAVNNGIIHGNKRNPKKKVLLTFERKNSALVICVQDEGKGFESAKLPDPLAEENLLRDHGRGVFLIRSLMDTVEFSNVKHGSVVTMTIKMKK